MRRFRRPAMPGGRGHGAGGGSGDGAGHFTHRSARARIQM